MTPAALVTILLAAAAFGAPPTRARREARSSAETWKTKDGRRMEHTVNRRFTFAQIHPERFGGSDVLLEETFDRLLDSGAEGEKSSVEVAAFSLAGKALWTIRTSGARDRSRRRVTSPVPQAVSSSRPLLTRVPMRAARSSAYAVNSAGPRNSS